jgi:hypothetical protein
MNSIVATGAGSGPGYRSTNLINALRFTGRGLISFGSSTKANRIRVIVACVNAGTTPLSTEDIDATPYGRRDPDLRTVLFDRTYVNTNDSDLKHFQISVPLKGIGIHFDGSATTDQDRKDIYLMTCSDTAGSDAGIDAHFKTTFSEH